jgi:U3 small nucleolar RNA-associated protein 20
MGPGHAPIAAAQPWLTAATLRCSHCHSALTATLQPWLTANSATLLFTWLQVLLKFPPEVIANLSATAYLPLVTRLANETSPKARTAVAATIKLLHKQLQPQHNDQLAGFAQQWLFKGSDDPQQQQAQQLLLLRAAAAHALGLLAEAEGPRFGQRRLSPEFVGRIVPLLDAAAAVADAALAASFAAGDDDAAQQQQQGEECGTAAGLSGGVPRWQEVYHVLLMLEKAVTGPHGVAPLSWQQGQQVKQLWRLLVHRLLLHPHLWVRKVAARLLGLGLAAPAVTDGLIAAKEAGVAAAADSSSSSSVSAGGLALYVYRQLDAEVVDEGLCTQAVKCLVALAKHLAAQQQQLEPAAAAAAADGSGGEEAADDEAVSSDEEDAAATAANGHHQAEDEEEEEEDAAAAADDDDDDPTDHQQQQQQQRKAEVSLQGLIVRMVRLAEDTRHARQLQRLAALRWIAAAAAAVGTGPLLPHLPLLLRPLFRIAEATGLSQARQQADASAAAAGGTPEEVRVLSEQVLAHLRALFGSEQMLTAYTAAREAVRAARAARKTAAARRVLLDPEAASRLKLKKGRKKSEARQRKAEQLRRQRAARGSGGFGYKAKGGGAGGKGRGGKGAGGRGRQ